MNQMELVDRKADVIIWCSAEECRRAAETVTILIHGWSTPDEIARVPANLTGPVSNRVLNHQVSVHEIHSTVYLGVPV